MQSMISYSNIDNRDSNVIQLSFKQLLLLPFCFYVRVGAIDSFQ